MANIPDTTKILPPPTKFAKMERADVAALVSRGVLGAIPLLGPMVAELVSVVIPGQRLDRISAFLQALESRVTALEPEILDTRLKAPGIVDVLEDILHQAARSQSGERISWLAELLVRGISEPDAEYERHKKMAWLLGQLTDAEVVWLMWIAKDYDEEFKTRHRSILEDRLADTGEGDPDALTLRQSWLDRLHGLGLIEGRFYKDGSFKRSPEQASPLGRLLVHYVGEAAPQCP